jgi:hypothetical protein
MAQLLVVVAVFVALGYGVDPLLNKGGQPVLDAERISWIVNAGRRRARQANMLINPAEQWQTAITADVATGKCSLYPAAFLDWK